MSNAIARRISRRAIAAAIALGLVAGTVAPIAADDNAPVYRPLVHGRGHSRLMSRRAAILDAERKLSYTEPGSTVVVTYAPGYGPAVDIAPVIVSPPTPVVVSPSVVAPVIVTTTPTLVHPPRPIIYNQSNVSPNLRGHYRSAPYIGRYSHPGNYSRSSSGYVSGATVLGETNYSDGSVSVVVGGRGGRVVTGYGRTGIRSNTPVIRHRNGGRLN